MEKKLRVYSIIFALLYREQIDKFIYLSNQFMFLCNNVWSSLYWLWICIWFFISVPLSSSCAVNYPFWLGFADLVFLFFWVDGLFRSLEFVVVIKISYVHKKAAPKWKTEHVWLFVFRWKTTNLRLMAMIKLDEQKNEKGHTAILWDHVRIFYQQYFLCTIFFPSF